MSKRSDRQQAKHRTLPDNMGRQDVQEAAIHYAQRKLKDPEGEREPLTGIEKLALVFLKKQAKDDAADNNGSN